MNFQEEKGLSACVMAVHKVKSNTDDEDFGTKDNFLEKAGDGPRRIHERAN